MSTGALTIQAEEAELMVHQDIGIMHVQELDSVDGYEGNASLKEKHREIDAYVFEQHQGDLQDIGFKVTHTGPMNGKIEIGIMPYEEEYVQYLQEQFGAEDIVVVEGVQAVTLIADSESVSSPADPGEPRLLADPDEAVSDADADAVATEAVPVSAVVTDSVIAESGAAEELALEARAMDQLPAERSNAVYAWAAAALAALLGLGAVLWKKRTSASK
ncbi:hypothetical protein DUZ99_08820 [Xylanibacillus composti]|uniref:Uncharacterized protein n=1 Tax=Xylanibacillus composti TaxID=1572762 RepID=A0A8J4H8I2_9BACL|nr:hypothetical protein [Xylanibacillus composti]MDT9725098.1 hypothetical protein [Xylanibacillus composti]GIQ70913.1 hypothetical protein XYCOK13_37370 [Xylanibacillus composti]